MSTAYIIKSVYIVRAILTHTYICVLTIHVKLAYSYVSHVRQETCLVETLKTRVKKLEIKLRHLETENRNHADTIKKVTHSRLIILVTRCNSLNSISNYRFIKLNHLLSFLNLHFFYFLYLFIINSGIFDYLTHTYIKIIH